jgi:hypothetical protein
MSAVENFLIDLKEKGEPRVSCTATVSRRGISLMVNVLPCHGRWSSDFGTLVSPI